MSIKKVDCKGIRGRIEPPLSKSYLQRFLICSYLFGAMNRAIEVLEARVPENQISDDIQATLDCLLALDDSHELDCRESGATLRMLLPVAAALDGDFVFHRGPSLASRPIQPLIDELNRHEAQISEHGSDILVSGKLEAGEYTVPGNITSQFISGLLFAFVVLDEACHLTVEGEVESKPYIDMSVHTIDVFRVWDEDECEYYELLNEILECDWSAAAIWYVANHLAGGTIQITGMNDESQQGDKEIVPMLQVLDEADTPEGKVHVFDLSNFPDIAPFVALAAIKSDCNLRIVNVGRLRLKESDRIKATVEILSQLGADIIEGEDQIDIKGLGNGEILLPGSEEPVNTYGDHRMVMLAAIASIICEKPVTIQDAEAVAKSYPDFFEKIKELGGKVEE